MLKTFLTTSFQEKLIVYIRYSLYFKCWWEWDKKKPNKVYVMMKNEQLINVDPSEWRVSLTWQHATMFYLVYDAKLFKVFNSNLQ